MIRIISKNVTALKTNPLINEEPFNQIQEQLNGTHPHDTRKKRYDSGKPKLTFFDDWLGLDSQNERAANPGAGMSLGRDPNESKDNRLSSGYNDGEQPDDETGPGNSSFTPDPYFTQDVDNELFMDLRIKGQDNNDAIQTHVKKVLRGNPVATPHRRYRVNY